MPVGSRILVALLLAGVCAAALPPECAAQSMQEADEDAAGRWATQNYEDVSTHVFGSPTSTDGLNLNIAWVVTARIRPAYDVDPEIQFSLTKAGSGEVTAVVTKLRTSLQLQLQELHREHRNTAPSEIAKLIKFDRFVVTQTQCPALKKISAAFEKLRTSIAFENALVLDPRQYQLWVDAGSEQVYLNVLGASNGESRHPIIVWIEETQQRLQRSIAPGRMPGGRIPSASEWSDPAATIPGYFVVPPGSPLKRGDVVAAPTADGRYHVGIYYPQPGGVPGTVSASARTQGVVLND